MIFQDYKSVTEICQEDFTDALHDIVPSTQRGSDITVDYKPIQWEDIGGLEEVKQQLQQVSGKTLGDWRRSNSSSNK